MTHSNQSTFDSIKLLREEVQKSFIGQDYVVERLIFALSANSKALVEGLPGLAKTRTVKSIAKVLEALPERSVLKINTNTGDM